MVELVKELLEIPKEADRYSLLCWLALIAIEKDNSGATIEIAKKLHELTKDIDDFRFAYPDQGLDYGS